MNQVRLVKRSVGVAVVGVGEKRRGVGLALLALVDDRGWGLVVVIWTGMGIGIHQVYQHLVHLLKRVQIHLQILLLLLHLLKLNPIRQLQW